AHQDSNLGPTDYESLADNQPQLTTTACVTSCKVSPQLFYCHLLSLVVTSCVAVVQIWSKLIIQRVLEINAVRRFANQKKALGIQGLKITANLLPCQEVQTIPMSGTHKRRNGRDSVSQAATVGDLCFSGITKK
ncbi:MAG: hypothetical protein CBC67_02015, partial [Gammaproteobacteria bacterium TMED107]